MKPVKISLPRRFEFSFKLLLPAIVLMQLSACGGGGSSKSTSEKIPDAYRVSSSSNYSVSAQGANGKNGKTGVMKLSWSAPTTRTDGEPLSLSEIDGYRLYYGKQKGTYVQIADIKDGTAQSATVTGLPVGTFYVAMTTYDANGIESDYSAAIRKRVG